MNMDMFMKFTNDTNEILLMVSGMIEIQEIEVQAIDDLMIIKEHVKDPSIYNELIALRNEIVENPPSILWINICRIVLSVYRKRQKSSRKYCFRRVYYSSLPGES